RSRREGMLDENPWKTQKQEAPAVNAVEEEPASIGELRRRIRELEKALSAYGFDCRRGIETYKVSEIKRILREAGPREGEARVILRELVEAQLALYRELYSAAGAREIVVDSDTPERRVKEIKEWLEGRGVKRGERVNLFAKTVYEVLNAVERNENVDSIVELLARSYKRDYDRFRVLRFLAELCGGFNAEAERYENLRELVKVTVDCVLRAGVDKVRRLAMERLRL
ncbi:MAG: hypothetical protein QXV79_04540, partial [Thermofilaceae archaeon]